MRLSLRGICIHYIRHSFTTCCRHPSLCDPPQGVQGRSWRSACFPIYTHLLRLGDPAQGSRDYHCARTSFRSTQIFSGPHPFSPPGTEHLPIISSLYTQQDNSRIVFFISSIYTIVFPSCQGMLPRSRSFADRCRRPLGPRH